MKTPELKDIKQALAFAGGGAAAIWGAKHIIGLVGSAYGPVLGSIAGLCCLSSVGISFLQPANLLPVMLASQFIKLVDPVKGSVRKDEMLKFGESEVKANSIGHMMNNSVRGILDYAVAVVVLDYANRILASQSVLSNPSLQWAVLIGCGGVAAKLFDSQVYKPYLEKRIAYGAHTVGELYGKASEAVHSVISM